MCDMDAVRSCQATCTSNEGSCTAGCDATYSTCMSGAC